MNSIRINEDFFDDESVATDVDEMTEDDDSPRQFDIRAEFSFPWVSGNQTVVREIRKLIHYVRNTPALTGTRIDGVKLFLMYAPGHKEYNVDPNAFPDSIDGQHIGIETSDMFGVSNFIMVSGDMRFSADISFSSPGELDRFLAMLATRTPDMEIGMKVIPSQDPGHDGRITYNHGTSRKWAPGSLVKFCAYDRQGRYEDLESLYYLFINDRTFLKRLIAYLGKSQDFDTGKMKRFLENIDDE